MAYKSRQVLHQGVLMFLFLTLGALVGIYFLLYNSVIGRKNEVENALGSLDAQLKQRYDLIPNLVSAVKTYMKHESGVLEKIVELRSQMMKNHLSTPEKQELNKKLSQHLSGLLVQVEQYPDLKSSANFQELQKALFEVEQNISASRRFYNSAVTDFNNAIEMFPTNFIARSLGLNRLEVFTIPEIERRNINVKNLFEDKAS